MLPSLLYHVHTAPGATPQTMAIVTYQRLQWMNINARPGHNHCHSSVIQKIKVYGIELIKELSCPAISYSSPHRRTSIHHRYHRNHITYFFSVFGAQSSIPIPRNDTLIDHSLSSVYIITYLWWPISRNIFVDQNLASHQPFPLNPIAATRPNCSQHNHVWGIEFARRARQGDH